MLTKGLSEKAGCGMLVYAHPRDAFVRSGELAIHRSPVQCPSVLGILQHLTLVRVKPRG